MTWEASHLLVVYIGISAAAYDNDVSVGFIPSHLFAPCGPFSLGPVARHPLLVLYRHYTLPLPSLTSLSFSTCLSYLTLPPRDLWRITRFLRTTGYQADLAACRQDFPGLLSFDRFLAASQWGDKSRTYEDGFEFAGLGDHDGDDGGLAKEGVGATAASATAAIRPE